MLLYGVISKACIFTCVVYLVGTIIMVNVFFKVSVGSWFNPVRIKKNRFNVCCFRSFEYLFFLLFKSQFIVGVVASCVQISYYLFQDNSCTVEGILVLKAPWFIYLWGFFYGLCYCLMDKFWFFLGYLSDKVRKWSTFCKMKLCNNTLVLG